MKERLFSSKDRHDPRANKYQYLNFGFEEKKLKGANWTMKHVVLSDELIEQMGDSYQDQKTSITFQQFFELELIRLRDRLLGKVLDEGIPL